MNKEEALELFHKYNDPRRWEYPEKYDYLGAISQFSRFVKALDVATGHPHKVETGSHIQDASFHSEVYINTGWLRFSNFGNMVSITPDHEVDSATVTTILRLCQEMGYTFIPTEFTELPYTGTNPGVTGIRNWWIRYFDYV